MVMGGAAINAERRQQYVQNEVTLMALKCLILYYEFLGFIAHAGKYEHYEKELL